MDSTAEVRISNQWLDEHIARAACCSDGTIHGDHFRALMILAMRAPEFDASGLGRLLEEFQGQEEVHLTGDELRMLLMLAKQVKQKDSRPRLHVVYGSTTKGRPSIH
jgi:hypothetical protein